jgi:hypothetical protein
MRINIMTDVEWEQIMEWADSHGDAFFDVKIARRESDREYIALTFDELREVITKYPLATFLVQKF